MMFQYSCASHAALMPVPVGELFGSTRAPTAQLVQDGDRERGEPG